MNPFYSFKMIMRRIVEILSAKIFDITLNLKFGITIGLYWSIGFEVFSLGMRIMVFALKFVWVNLLWRILWFHAQHPNG